MKTPETTRLILRNWKPEDAADLYEYAKNPNVGRGAGWPPHTCIEDSEKIIKMFTEKDDVWALALKGNGKVIGSLGLHEDRKRRDVDAKMIGYCLSEEYWGKGLAPEAVRRVLEFAFEELGVSIVSVYHFPDNMRSKRVIKKCGFHYEGTPRMTAKIFDGTVVDDVCYSMTREEYFADERKEPKEK